MQFGTNSAPKSTVILMPIKLSIKHYRRGDFRADTFQIAKWKVSR